MDIRRAFHHYEARTNENSCGSRKIFQNHRYDHKNKGVVFTSYFSLLHCSNQSRKT